MKALANTLLALASIAVALALSELAARALLSRYDQLADPPRRHYSAAPISWPHPDTGVLHRVSYSNLGGRQHRNFDAAELRAGLNIAFFGDSFTENRRMAAPYSFTEPLDHLLNALSGHAGEREGLAGGETSINVLNFGAEGTGPGAQFLLYRRAPHRNRFAHVVYVHCDNDFRDLGNSGQWALDAAGGLVARARGETAAWVRFSSGLHLTYLGLDAWRRLIGAGGPAAARTEPGDALFRAVVLRWRREVERNGGRFHVAVLPKPGTSERFAAVGWPADLDVLDLAACFRELAPGGRWEDDWRFANDGHWNEAGNMLAARCLLRDLAPRLGLPAIDGDALEAELRAYYQAFADNRRWDGQHWAPQEAPPPKPLAAGEAEAIVSRYLAFGVDVDDGPEGALLWRREFAPEAPKTITDYRREYRRIATTEPTVRALWRVYNIGDGEIAYLKEPCNLEELRGQFFLRVLPATAGVELARVGDGFVPWINKDGRRGLERAYFRDYSAKLIRRWYAHHFVALFDNRCLLKAWLPPWRTATVWTGHQITGSTNRWEAKFHLDMGRFERALRSDKLAEASRRRRTFSTSTGPPLVRAIAPSSTFANPARPKTLEHVSSCIS